MSDHSIHRVGDLASDERLIVERWLGRALSNDEIISLNAWRAHGAPDDATRQTLRRESNPSARYILDEVERVLLYPRIQTRYRITAGKAARFAANLADAAHLVEPVIAGPLVLSDPADDPVLYTAADGGADILCTRNTRHFSSAAVQAFCDDHGIRVMTDLDVLRDLFLGSAPPPPDV